ncbi:hypothetical protein [Candidatus Nitrotoga sp. AM1P]|nr:hypothetical protein [Candidatus Nitrotoga sp. AM1P]
MIFDSFRLVAAPDLVDFSIVLKHAQVLFSFIEQFELAKVR